MKVLKAIIKQSKYKPEGGLKGELYRLVAEENYDTEAAKAYFDKRGKGKQFRIVQQNLKENLLDWFLIAPLYNLTTQFRNRLKLWRKQLQAKILLQTNSKIAGIKIAIDTIPLAERNEEFEIVHSLCRELITQYSTASPNPKKYGKYRTKMERMERWIQEELKVEKLYRDICNTNNKKQSLVKYESIINELELLVKENKNFRFRYFYYSTKSLYFQIIGDFNSLLENNQNAFDFFDSYPRKIHYITKFKFLNELIPYYIFRGAYERVEICIQKCLAMPPKGTHNWQLVLLYRAAMGFYNQQPNISLSCYNLSQSAPRKFKHKIIELQWYLIKGYLAIYTILGKLPKGKKIRMSIYLNINQEQHNNEQKANMVIIELLHFLFTDSRLQYLNKIERIDAYNLTRFKAHTFARTRNFLKMLRAVIKGNFHPIGAQRHAERYKKALQKTKHNFDADILEREIVPYEVLWDLVIEYLNNNRRR